MTARAAETYTGPRVFSLRLWLAPTCALVVFMVATFLASRENDLWHGAAVILVLASVSAAANMETQADSAPARMRDACVVFLGLWLARAALGQLWRRNGAAPISGNVNYMVGFLDAAWGLVVLWLGLPTSPRVPKTEGRVPFADGRAEVSAVAATVTLAVTVLSASPDTKDLFERMPFLASALFGAVCVLVSAGSAHVDREYLIASTAWIVTAPIEYVMGGGILSVLFFLKWATWKEDAPAKPPAVRPFPPPLPPPPPKKWIPPPPPPSGSWGPPRAWTLSGPTQPARQFATAHRTSARPLPPWPTKPPAPPPLGERDTPPQPVEIVSEEMEASPPSEPDPDSPVRLVDEPPS